MTAATAYIAKGLTVLISLVSVPLTVQYLGAERYGVWLTISSLLLWVALTDFGLAGNALINVLSEALGNDDREIARQLTASAFWALVTIALILGVVFIATFHSIPWRTLFRVSSATSTGELELTGALVLTFFVISLPLNLVRSLFNAHQDGYFANIWWIVGAIISLFGLIVVTRFQGGLPPLVLATSGAPAVVIFASAYHAFVCRYPWLAPVPSAVRWTCIRRLLKLGGKYMIMQLANLGICQSQAMIITQMLGPSQVVIFVAAFRLITLPADLVYMGTAPFIAAFGEAKVRHDWKWIKGAFKKGTFASVALGVPLAAALTVASKPLILIWAGPYAVPDPPLAFWLFIYAVVAIPLMMTGQLLSGVERVEPLLLSIVLCAIGCIAFAIALAPWCGLSGVAFAMTISLLIAMWPIQLYEVRRLFRAADAMAPTVMSN
jgi:O-antigen/teichoic acid export membrane protein